MSTGFEKHVSTRSGQLPKIIKSNAVFKDVFIYQTILFFKKSIFDEAAFVFQGISESLIYKSFLTVSL